ncbi:MAG: elongation factor 4 [Candidatus Andersenbacteria bacterium RIFCSPHIGHO2_02_FULL_45_11]|uniref:Elongation factor 4 n=1 Tax=Candidatus Andersenbacteria bacterium RIFCSPHIGHO2_12_FULL_45_11 TaxID=1797281 RepID=A0A1G1X0Y5_9BACT|nr:MAG: elongation factor 4 [Candidatus Andersenbacteria bacterium RIFCSPHIGHO2_01_FULL_46_36]OGY32416.1 MAG: elongation factor 4 [Candidatus Andersenbacteria bacterium RIFCSPHIGHO2_02_FULL_45_11]OGY33675.1 MAG: elongation factor 4 [Candidatus Andersenbacteria bacterium RIFCSPHIGHO2_12_FULL_45_11]
MEIPKIRNFCIIAHIDHGKSTLADRMLELTHTVEMRNMQAQLLDSMELEREKGITIKLQPVRMEYKGYILNLIDTPGHVDFQYEVSRSLKAVEGAILLVDATQGVQAQTVSNVYFALEQNLEIIPVINKIDLPAADVEGVSKEIIDLLGVKKEDIMHISAKTGQGVPELLDAVCRKLPAAVTDASGSLRALIFDSVYDDYKGVVAYVRVMEGTIGHGEGITFLGTDVDDKVVEVGVFKPQFTARKNIGAGEIGYIATGLKNIRDARVGDTITKTTQKQNVEQLPGYAIPQPKVFAGLYPVDASDFPVLREAMSKLQLNDASLTSHMERSHALGQGFRCGFLGMLHLEIVQERLKREFDIPLVITTPSVLYKVKLTSGKDMSVHTADAFPDPSHVQEMQEQWSTADILLPAKYMGAVFELMQQHEGVLKSQEYLGTDRILLHYELPLRELVVDLYDHLKSVTSGYGSLSYDMIGWRPADVVKLSVLINHEVAEALCSIVPRHKAEAIGRKTVEKLKEVIPRQLFAVPLQAAIGGKVVARESISAMRKDVTAKLYGGDVTRKRKLLDKQKKGKKRMATTGSIEIPPEAYITLLKR